MGLFAIGLAKVMGAKIMYVSTQSACVRVSLCSLVFRLAADIVATRLQSAIKVGANATIDCTKQSLRDIGSQSLKLLSPVSPSLPPFLAVCYFIQNLLYCFITYIYNVLSLLD